MSGEQSATGDCGAQCNSNVDGEGGGVRHQDTLQVMVRYH